MTTPAAAPHHENPYGIWQALQQGGLIAQATFGILVIMSAASWYVLFVKLFEQQKIAETVKNAASRFRQKSCCSVRSSCRNSLIRR